MSATQCGLKSSWFVDVRVNLQVHFVKSAWLFTSSTKRLSCTLPMICYHWDNRLARPRLRTLYSPFFTVLPRWCASRRRSSIGKRMREVACSQGHVIMKMNFSASSITDSILSLWCLSFHQLDSSKEKLGTCKFPTDKRSPWNSSQYCISLRARLAGWSALNHWR